MDTILTPYRAPNCNAFAERFVRSIKEECLDRMIFFGESSLHRATREFVEHYHIERPHQGLGNEIIEKTLYIPVPSAEVRCDERLGGILKHYRREA